MLLLIACAVAPPTEDSAVPGYDQVAVILDTHCVRCHRSGGPMEAGVELDLYESASSTRVKNACVAISPALIERYGDALLPLAGEGSAVPCEGWQTLSMPPGAIPRLSEAEQLTLAAWTAAGGPR